MATLVVEHGRVCILSLVLLIFFFLWMDMSLYYKIQEISPRVLNSKTFNSSTNSINDLSSNFASTELAMHKDNHLFSPFKGLSVKMMMMDQMNNYIFTPLAEIFNEATDFSHNFSYITPNMISFIGILWSVVAGKLVAYDSITLQRLSVLFFQIRTFCDALDGIVARTRLGIKQHVSLSNTPGYIVDGLADSAGFLAYMIGCYIFLRHNLPKNSRYSSPQYLPLQHFDVIKSSQSSFVIAQYVPSKLIWTTRQVFFVVAFFLLQMAISCILWNRYIEAYHRLLEYPALSSAQASLRNQILKSSFMWVIMWFWRISNAQSLMQMLLVAVYVNRLWVFLIWIQYIGFIELFTLSFFTELHLWHVTSILTHNG